MGRRSTRVAHIVVLLLLASANIAVAKTANEEAKEHYIEGSKLFDLMRYDDAVREFEAAYRAKPDPAFLYNIAQSYRLSGQLEKAVRFYRNYLNHVPPKSSHRADIERRIADLEKTIETQRSQIAAQPSGTMAPVPAPDAPTTTPAPALAVTPPDPRDKDKDDKPRPKWPIWVGVAGGVVLAGAAVTIGVLATRPDDPVIEWSAR